MAPIIAHVVAAERQHRHRIAPHHAHGAGSRRGGFGRQCRAQKSAMLPVEGLIDQRNQFLPARAEKNRADRHAFGLFPLRRIGRALFDRHREARVGVRRRVAAFGIPGLAAPILSVVGHRIVMAFPPDGAVGSRSATLVKMVSLLTVFMALGLVFEPVPGATPKKPASGLIAQSLPS